MWAFNCFIFMKRRPFFLAALMVLSSALFSCSGNVTITTDQGETSTEFQVIPEGNYDIHIQGEIYTRPDDSIKHSEEETLVNDDDSLTSDDKEEVVFEVGVDTICDMEALFKALCDEDVMYRDYESQVTYAENSLHGWTFSRMDAYSSSLDVKCKPLADGSFKVVATVNSIEDGVEDSIILTYIFREGKLNECEEGN